MANYGGGTLYKGAGVWFDFRPEPLIAIIDASIYARMEKAMSLAADWARENMQAMTESPSLRGEMPAMVSKTLRDNIEYRVDMSPGQIVGSFGVFKSTAPNSTTGELVDLIYALYLETGTAKMDPRPWLTLTMAELWGQWQSILGTGGGFTTATAGVGVYGQGPAYFTNTGIA